METRKILTSLLPRERKIIIKFIEKSGTFGLSQSVNLLAKTKIVDLDSAKSLVNEYWNRNPQKVEFIYNEFRN